MKASRPSISLPVIVGLLYLCAVASVALAAGGAPKRGDLDGSPRQGGEALPRTSLPMQLVGVMVDSADASRSACLVRCTSPGDRRSASYLEVGKTACDLAEVREIREDAVVLWNQPANRLERLALETGGSEPRISVGVAAPSPAPEVVKASPDRVNVEIPKASLDQYLLNLPDLLSSALATPRFRDAAGGQRVIEGFELTQIKAGSITEKVGLKDGDVIVEVNGETLDGLATVMRLFGQAQTAGKANVTVLRGSQRLTFVFNTK